MKLKFNIVAYGVKRYTREINNAYLIADNWDDYGFKTQFYLEVVNGDGQEISIGQVKIGFVDQEIGWTLNSMPSSFSELPGSYFSLGQDVDYYKKIESLPSDFKNQLLESMRDMVADAGSSKRYENEKVFTTSLLRSSSYLSIGDQYRRILSGGAEQTSYNFIYKVDQNEESAGLELKFSVRPESKPSTNIHVLIGRNGIGKTTLLNGMISALIKNQGVERGFGNFWDMRTHLPKIIENDYFTALVSVSFSAFDPFTPPMDIEEPGQHIRYSYIGLKKVFYEEGIAKSEHKDIEKFADDFSASAAACFNSESKRKRWIRAIRFLESDSNFADMDLTRFATDVGQHKLQELNKRLFEKMSSGHAIILLTITKLVEKVDEKTLVLMDEPESHLHPPLLSAFTRALADLLTNRNGVAIIATHSPVLLQEVPRECVWKLRRNGLIASADRPESETFAENVGFLTREVFQLEVAKSGFHHLLAQSVFENKSYDEILSEYSGKIGFEGKALLRAMLTAYAEGRI